MAALAWQDDGAERAEGTQPTVAVSRRGRRRGAAAPGARPAWTREPAPDTSDLAGDDLADDFADEPTRPDPVIAAPSPIDDGFALLEQVWSARPRPRRWHWSARRLPAGETAVVIPAPRRRRVWRAWQRLLRR